MHTVDILPQTGALQCYLVLLIAGLGPIAVIIGSVIVAAGPQVRSFLCYVEALFCSSMRRVLLTAID